MCFQREFRSERVTCASVGSARVERRRVEGETLRLQGFGGGVGEFEGVS